MTSRTRDILKSMFETGDIPDGSDYADIFDSFLSLSDTAKQSITSDIVVPDFTATSASVGAVNITGVLRLGGVPAIAHVTAAVSAAASVNRYLKITVSGVEYGIPVHAI